LLPYAIGTGALVFGGLALCSDDFHLGTQGRGFIHAILLSELATNTAKVVFQKKRPTYDAQVQGNQGEDTNDSRVSFYSGHANHAFNFATYTSLMMFKFSNSTTLSTLYTATSFAAASVISYSRVQDHAHNLTDVVVGALMGTTISSLVFFRVQEVNAQLNPTQHHPLSTFRWNLTPGMTYDETGKAWYMADFKLEI
jgi:membrane-associated phospholipid phosphatase